MRSLYLAIILGLGVLYYVNSQQKEEGEQVKRGDISEGGFEQEAPPSMQDINYIKKFLPDYDANAPI